MVRIWYQTRPNGPRYVQNKCNYKSQRKRKTKENDLEKRFINNATNQREREKIEQRTRYIVIKIMSQSFITGKVVLKPVAAFLVQTDAHSVRASLTQP
jgi:hypothetical protein